LFLPDKTHALVVFHPVTLTNDSTEQFQELLRAVEKMHEKGILNGNVLFIHPNADDGQKLSIDLQSFCAKHKWAISFQSLPRHVFLSCLYYVNMLIGNSSSGIYEAPSMKKPSVNIGTRQKGRMRAKSVIDCDPKQELIEQAITLALNIDCKDVVNPYGCAQSAKKIVQILQSIPDFKSLIVKKFFELNFQSTL